MILLCNSSEAADGIVVTVDGINPLSTATGSIFGDSSTGYIYVEIIKSAKKSEIISTIGQIQPFYWANDANYTDTAAQSLANILRTAYAQTSESYSPLVVVSHSWGTVLTYIALHNNPDIIVDKLITMGSPLSVSPFEPGIRGIIGGFTTLKLAFQGIYDVHDLPNIKSWHNYWTPCDIISSPITASIYNHNSDISLLDEGLCHRAYYENAQTWDGILQEVLNPEWPLKIIDDPSYPSAPANIMFTASGFLVNNMNSYQWDFGDGQKGSGNPTTHYYKQPNNYTVTLTMTDTGPHVLTKSVTVSQPQITVTYPNGFEDPYRHFSTPEISGIQSYVWDYGDGEVRTDDDNTTSHSYTTPGYYTVTLTQTLSDNTPIQSQKGFFVGSGTRYIQGHTIYDDETWDSGGTYVVQGNITVTQGASLTIEPGARVELHGGVQFTVYGTLTANGVTFTWADGVNQWSGIWFSGAGSSNSILENCVIEHASYISITYSSPTITGCMINANELSITNGYPIISNNTISLISSYGINIYNSGPTVTGNMISGSQYGIYLRNSSGIYQGNTLANNQYGMYADLTYNPIISGNTYSNNTVADLYLKGTINMAVNWNETGGLVYQLDNLTIAQGASLNIESGRTVKLTSKALIKVYGTLTANGVTFTWADGVNGWNGISFVGVGSTNSRLEDCILQHVRADYWDGPPYYQYHSVRPIAIGNYSSPTITGCTINNSDAERGISIGNGSPVISDNKISGFDIGITIHGSGTYQGNILSNNRYGIFTDLTNNPMISGNTYSNNSSADLLVSGSINSAVYWDETGDIVYEVEDLTISQGASLTITSGKTVKLSHEWYGQITVYGTLNANGVTFTSIEESYPWNGIRFEGTGSTNSRLENCVIEHAMGAEVDHYFHRGILSIINSSPTITGCMINNSSASSGIYIDNSSPVISDNTINGIGNGVYVIGNSSPTVTGNTVTNNSSSGIYMHGNSSGTYLNNTITGNGFGIYALGSGSGTYQGNTIMNNLSYGIFYSGGGVFDATYNYWGDASGPLDNSDDRASGGFFNPTGLGDRVSDHVKYYPWKIDYPDTDNDSILDDGDTSGIVGDNPCTGGNTTNCDDNCWLTPNPDQVDIDGDKTGDVCDNCSQTSNSLQEDTDNDGLGNACDSCTDIDKDGYAIEGGSCGDIDCNDDNNNIFPGATEICDGIDNNCDGNIDADCLDTCLNDPQNDIDSDGICGDIDNCPDSDNPYQEDIDRDNIGDACDDDIDGDGAANVTDNCPTVANPDQADADSDGFGDVCTVTYCVTNSFEFRDALTMAAGNGMNDVIKLVQGTYGILYWDSFYYESSQSYSLAIKGGYSSGCSSRELNPGNTVLEGESIAGVHSRVITLYNEGALSFNKIIVEGVTIKNGLVQPIEWESVCGAGIFINSNSSIILMDNVIKDNTGGGICVYSVSGKVTLSNNVIANNNDANSGGITVYSSGVIDIINNTITEDDSSGIYLDVDNMVNIYNNIIWDNDAASGGSIFIEYNSVGTVNVYNNVLDSVQAYESFTNEGNNINEDPLFADAINGDYHLLTCSPAINAGNNSAPSLPATDFEGDSRIIGIAADIGADEYAYAIVDSDCDGVNDDIDNCIHIYNPDQLDTDDDKVGDACDNCSETYNPLQVNTDIDGYGNICDCDLDNDGFVGPNDYNIFGMAWWSADGSPNWNPDADFDSDGFVGPNDYNLLGMRWWTVAPWK
jgi:parallel beta-helix repeat protein